MTDKRFYQSRTFWLDAGERTVMTGLQALLAILVMTGFAGITTAALAGIGSAALAAFIKSALAASRVGPDNDGVSPGSLVPERLV